MGWVDIEIPKEEQESFEQWLIEYKRFQVRVRFCGNCAYYPSLTVKNGHVNSSKCGHFHHGGCLRFYDDEGHECAFVDFYYKNGEVIRKTWVQRLTPYADFLKLFEEYQHSLEKFFNYKVAFE